jgi:hypothetical protein
MVRSLVKVRMSDRFFRRDDRPPERRIWDRRSSIAISEHSHQNLKMFTLTGLIHLVQDDTERPYTMGGYVERHARHIALLLLSVGWVGCADPQREPTPAGAVIPAGPTVQEHGIVGYRIGRISGAAMIALVDATGASRGQLLVEGSAATDDAGAVSGAGAMLHLRLDGVESTKRVRLAKGLYTVDDGRTGYVDSVSVVTDDAFGALLADPPLMGVFADHQLSFVSRPSEVAYYACNPPPRGFMGSSIQVPACDGVPASTCDQWVDCQTVYDTCVSYTYNYCCGEIPRSTSPDESFICSSPYVCGGPFEYRYACNPHPGNCITRQQVRYDLTSCTCANVLVGRICNLPPSSCQSSCPTACRQMQLGINNVGGQGCCIEYVNEYFDCLGPSDPVSIDQQFQVPFQVP